MNNQKNASVPLKSDAEMAALKAAKKSLRSLMKTRLSSIPVSSLDSQSTRLHEALLSFPPYQCATRISVYLSMPSGEIQTDSIVRSALSTGKTVFIPYMHANPMHRKLADGEITGGPKKVMDMVSLKGLSDYEGLERDGWGIPTVSESDLAGRERILGTGSQSAVKGLDLMLLPGVAFDKTADGEIRRLGHGRGFYDFFLERYRNAHGNADEAKQLDLYALALEEQLLKGGTGEDESVPVGPLDSLLDGLLIGDGKVVRSGTAN